jgi:hypothetical protein
MRYDSGIRGRTAKEMLRNVVEQTRPIRGMKSKAPQAIGFNTPSDDDFLERVAKRLCTDEEFEKLKAWNAEPHGKLHR